MSELCIGVNSGFTLRTQHTAYRISALRNADKIYDNHSLRLNWRHVWDRDCFGLAEQVDGVCWLEIGGWCNGDPRALQLHWPHDKHYHRVVISTALLRQASVPRPWEDKGLSLLIGAHLVRPIACNYNITCTSSVPRCKALFSRW